MESWYTTVRPEQDLEIVNYWQSDRKNDADTNAETFVIDKNFTDTIKWCRRNFGERGDGWDFTAGTKSVQIKIWSSKLITMWKMWKE